MNLLIGCPLALRKAFDSQSGDNEVQELPNLSITGQFGCCVVITSKKAPRHRMMWGLESLSCLAYQRHTADFVLPLPTKRREGEGM